jgi:hypothetical protein
MAFAADGPEQVLKLGLPQPRETQDVMIVAVTASARKCQLCSDVWLPCIDYTAPTPLRYQNRYHNRYQTRYQTLTQGFPSDVVMRGQGPFAGTGHP